LDLPYDYGSIMHYGPYAFSKNGLRTIKALKTGGDKMGQRDGFSSLDLQKLNKLYQCDASTNGGDDGDEPIVATAAPTRRPSGVVTTRRPSPTQTKKCENSKWQCFFWSRLGYCRSYRDYMLQYCPKDCDMCDEITSSNNANREATLAPPSSVGCSDSNDHCSQWSNSGYCDREGFEDFMRQTCAQSCGTCGDAAQRSNNAPPEQDAGTASTGNCADNSAFKSTCKTYAFWGFCTGTNEDFMRQKCKKSCNFC
jgi:hypothetical protein